jgi:phenylalanyl-tRNA synthetase beta chain
VTLSNPLSEDQSVMRTTLLGSLLGAAQRNLSRGAERVGLFESGRVYLPAAEVGPGPLGGDFPGNRRAPANEPQHLAALVSGPLDPPSWADPRNGSDFFALKGMLERLGDGLGVSLEVVPGEQPFLHPGRSGEVLIGETPLGWIGEIHPAVAAGWDLGKCLAFEIGMAGLLDASPLGDEVYEDFTPFPPADRDVAVVIAEDVAAGEVVAAVRKAGGPLLVDAAIFDVYQGKGIAEEEKSIALRLRFRAGDRTLSDEDVEPAWKDVVSALEGLGGRLRG